MTRQQFLDSLWQAYPPSPLSTAIKGRVLEVLHGEILLRVHSDQNNDSLQEQKISAQKLREGAPLSVLLPGDWVSIDPAGIVTLHSPLLKNTHSSTASRLQTPALEKKETLQRWSFFRQQVRHYFTQENFLEVDTPSLVICPGSEPTLDVFSTELKIGSRNEKLFLPTSPEWHLKKVLSQGLPKIFEIRPCFRNGELTPRHQPEFWMIEWYRAFANLQTIKKDSLLLIEHLCEQMKVARPKNIRSFTVAELFKIHLAFDLHPSTTEAELRNLAKHHHIDLRAAESIDDCFYLIFMEKIENQWDTEEVVFVENYPPYQAALARLTPDGWGDRFEIYWRGFELANAFHELNDPKIQRQRFNEDLEKKRVLGKEMIGTDEEFFAALDFGLPPSAGIALGLERLFLAMHNMTELQALRLFPQIFRS